MQIYALAFSSTKALTLAFQRLGESERVESYTIEYDALRLRFLAPRRAAEALVDRIYLDGGLTWCSRHDPADPMRSAPVLPLRGSGLRS